MEGKGRIAGAVAAGALAWFVLWSGGTMAAQAAFPEVIDPNWPLTHVGALWGYILYSVILSVAAGYITAAVARSAAMTAVWVLAGLQFALGVYFEISFWSYTPVWYHLVFLSLIVPATLYGGTLRKG